MKSTTSSHRKSDISCQIEKSDQLGNHPTVGRLLKALEEKLQAAQDQDAEADATKQLEADFEKLDSAYKAIPTYVSEYQEEREKLLTDLKEIDKDTGGTYKLLKDKSDPDWIEPDLRQAIWKFKGKYYDNVKKELEDKKDDEWMKFKNIR